MPLWAWSIAWAGIGNPNSYSNHDGYLIMFNIFKYIHFYGSISLLPGGMRDIKFKARTLVCLHSYSKPRLICILLWDTELKKEGRKRRERERERWGSSRISCSQKRARSYHRLSRHATIRLLALEDWLLFYYTSITFFLVMSSHLNINPCIRLFKSRQESQYVRTQYCAL